MNIVYADDDQLSLEIVYRALQARGHRVITVNSSRLQEMLCQFQQVLSDGPLPQIVILDGHNVARDAEGQVVIDVDAGHLVHWFQRQGVPAGIRFVLYSSDDQLVAQAAQNQHLGFYAAVAKAGTNGGLKALLNVVEAD